MFPIVLVQVRQWGAWKLHPYNVGAQNLFLLLSLWQNWINFEPQIATIIHESMMNCSYSPPLQPYCLTIPTNSFVPSVSFLTTKKSKQVTHWYRFHYDPFYFALFSLPLFQPACFLIFSLFSFFPTTHFFPWQYKYNELPNIISSAPLTPFMTHTLTTYLYPVSCDLSSSNDIGFTHNGAIINFWFMVFVFAKM